jgi:hypothetical protein
MRAGHAASAEMESIGGDTKVSLRADIAGSLLRPGSIYEARRRGQNGVINDAGLRAVDDAAVQGVIAPRADRPACRRQATVMRQGEGEQREEMMMSMDREGAVRELRFGRRSFSDLTSRLKLGHPGGEDR